MKQRVSCGASQWMTDFLTDPPRARQRSTDTKARESLSSSSSTSGKGSSLGGAASSRKHALRPAPPNGAAIDVLSSADGGIDADTASVGAARSAPRRRTLSSASSTLSLIDEPSLVGTKGKGKARKRSSASSSRRSTVSASGGSASSGRTKKDVSTSGASKPVSVPSGADTSSETITSARAKKNLSASSKKTTAANAGSSASSRRRKSAASTCSSASSDGGLASAANVPTRRRRTTTGGGTSATSSSSSGSVANPSRRGDRSAAAGAGASSGTSSTASASLDIRSVLRNLTNAANASSDDTPTTLSGSTPSLGPRASSVPVPQAATNLLKVPPPLSRSTSSESQSSTSSGTGGGRTKRKLAPSAASILIISSPSSGSMGGGDDSSPTFGSFTPQRSGSAIASGGHADAMIGGGHADGDDDDGGALGGLKLVPDATPSAVRARRQTSIRDKKQRLVEERQAEARRSRLAQRAREEEAKELLARKQEQQKKKRATKKRARSASSASTTAKGRSATPKAKKELSAATDSDTITQNSSSKASIAPEGDAKSERKIKDVGNAEEPTRKRRNTSSESKVAERSLEETEVAAGDDEDQAPSRSSQRPQRKRRKTATRVNYAEMMANDEDDDRVDVEQLIEYRAPSAANHDRRRRSSSAPRSLSSARGSRQKSSDGLASSSAANESSNRKLLSPEGVSDSLEEDDSSSSGSASVDRRRRSSSEPPMAMTGRSRRSGTKDRRRRRSAASDGDEADAGKDDGASSDRKKCRTRKAAPHVVSANETSEASSSKSNQRKVEVVSSSGTSEVRSEPAKASKASHKPAPRSKSARPLTRAEISRQKSNFRVRPLKESSSQSKPSKSKVKDHSSPTKTQKVKPLKNYRQTKLSFGGASDVESTASAPSNALSAEPSEPAQGTKSDSAAKVPSSSSGKRAADVTALPDDDKKKRRKLRRISAIGSALPKSPMQKIPAAALSENSEAATSSRKLFSASNQTFLTASTENDAGASNMAFMKPRPLARGRRASSSSATEKPSLSSLAAACSAALSVNPKNVKGSKSPRKRPSKADADSSLTPNTSIDHTDRSTSTTPNTSLDTDGSVTPLRARLLQRAKSPIMENSVGSSHKKLPSKLVLDVLASPEPGHREVASQPLRKPSDVDTTVSNAFSALDSLSGAFDFDDDTDVIDPDNSFESGVTSDDDVAVLPGEALPLHERLGRLRQQRSAKSTGSESAASSDRKSALHEARSPLPRQSPNFARVSSRDTFFRNPTKSSPLSESPRRKKKLHRVRSPLSPALGSMMSRAKSSAAANSSRFGGRLDFGGGASSSSSSSSSSSLMNSSSLNASVLGGEAFEPLSPSALAAALATPPEKPGTDNAPSDGSSLARQLSSSSSATATATSSSGAFAKVSPLKRPAQRASFFPSPRPLAGLSASSTGSVCRDVFGAAREDEKDSGGQPMARDTPLSPLRSGTRPTDTPNRRSNRKRRRTRLFRFEEFGDDENDGDLAATPHGGGRATRQKRDASRSGGIGNDEAPHVILGRCVELKEVLQSLNPDSSIARVALDALSAMPESHFNQQFTKCFAQLSRAERLLQSEELKASHIAPPAHAPVPRNPRGARSITGSMRGPTSDFLSSSSSSSSSQTSSGSGSGTMPKPRVRRIRFACSDLATVAPPRYCCLGSQKPTETLAQHVFEAFRALKFLSTKSQLASNTRNAQALLKKLQKASAKAVGALGADEQPEMRVARRFITAELKRFLNDPEQLPFSELVTRLLSSLVRFYMKVVFNAQDITFAKKSVELLDVPEWYSEVGTWEFTGEDGENNTLAANELPTEQQMQQCEFVNYHAAEIGLKLQTLHAFEQVSDEEFAAVAQEDRVVREEAIGFMSQLADVSWDYPMYQGDFTQKVNPNSSSSKDLLTRPRALRPPPAAVALNRFERALRASWRKLQGFSALAVELDCRELAYASAFENFRGFLEGFLPKESERIRK